MYRYFFLFYYLWPLDVPLGTILGIISFFHYAQSDSKKNRWALAGSFLGLIAILILWSSDIFKPFVSFHPGGVEGSIDIKMFIIGMSFSFPAIWFLLRSTRRLAVALAISLLIIVIPSYIGAIHFIYAG